MALQRIVIVDPEGKLSPVLRQTLDAAFLSVTYVARDFARAQTLLAGKGAHSVLMASAGPDLQKMLGVLRAAAEQDGAGVAVLALLSRPTDEEVRSLIAAGVDQLASLPVNAAQIDQKLRALDKLQAERRKAVKAARIARPKPGAPKPQADQPGAQDDPDAVWEI